MMKRSAITFLLLLYVVSISGATFSIHFCGSKLQAIALEGLGHAKCCCGSKKMDSNCCKDILITVKTAGEHKCVESTTVPISIPQNTLAELPEFLSIGDFSLVGENHSQFHPPPIRDGDIDLLILYSVFRI